MRIQISSVFVCGILAIVTVFGGDYSWNGGAGIWGVSSNWTPNGVPGTAVDDTASFAAGTSQTVTVDADTTLHRASIDTLAAGVRQTFSILPGFTLSLDTLGFSTTAANDVTVNGGGTLSVTNAQLNISGAEHPTVLTVSGEGTVLDKQKGDLCIGATDTQYKDSPDFLHVTDGATVRAPAYTCVGGLVDGSGTLGGLVIADGASFISSGNIFIGRGYTGYPGCLCTVTNATLRALYIGAGCGGNTLFAGKNATIAATGLFAFPRSDTLSWNAIMQFDDSVLTAPSFKVLTGSHTLGSVASTGCLTRCSLDCGVFSAADVRSRDSLFKIADSTLTCQNFMVGQSLSTNCALQLVRTAVSAQMIWVGCSNVIDSLVRVEGGTIVADRFRTGCEQSAKGVRYEQIGGAFTAFSEMYSGCYDSVQCGARFTAVDLIATNIVCGDSSVSGLRPVDDYLEFADMTRMEVLRLRVGLGSIGAHLTITNSTAVVSCPDTTDANSVIVGRDGGATRNVMMLMSSTLNQKGGNLYVGLNSYATNNTLRLVNSTYNFTTANNKGDVIVGKGANANGNRLELDGHSTFYYDRNWISIGHNGSSNVLAICNDSSLNLPSSNSQLHIGNYNSTSAKGNRLVMENGGTLSVKSFYMGYDTVVEIVGAGNDMTLGSNFAGTRNGSSFLFRPGAEEPSSPMLTVNRPFPYSSNVPLVVDFSDAGFGRYVLVSSSSEVAEPVIGSNVVLRNFRPRFVVRLTRTPDNKGLVCKIMPKGIVIDFK